jgi:putative transcriptional regulator
MKPSHHPNDDIVMRYAAATLSEGPSLVIGVHMAVCGQCRARAETFETVGGVVLNALEPTPMTPDSYAKVLKRIDADEKPALPTSAAEAEIVPGLAVPARLRAYRIGRWRTLAPGLKFSRIRSPRKSSMNVFMLRAAPGMSLLEHGHTDDEYLCVLKGSFTDQDGRHRAGDMAIASADVEHKPIVDRDGECICIVALEGKLRLRSMVGRLLQPVYGL